MKNLTNGLRACLLILVFAAAQPAHASGPVADGTRMVPGDVVIGNLVQFGPGHAGIYIGKWRNLPADLRQKYAKAFDEVIIRSRDHGLKESYLVVDSMPGKGVRMRSFVEQFSGYMPSLKPPTLVSALVWEADKGAAVGWPDLPAGDPRRWAIVEEALKAAIARVPYELRHMQLETTVLRSNDHVPYDKIDPLDCIAFVHVMYWRGAKIDLDVSLWPIHRPQDLYSEAVKKKMTRNVDLEHVYRATAITGLWTVTIKTLDRDPEEGFNGTFPMWVEYLDGTIHMAALDEGDPFPVPADALYPLVEKVTMRADKSLSLTQSVDGTTFDLKLSTDGKMSGSVEWVSASGPVVMTVSGQKKKDLVNIR